MQIQAILLSSYQNDQSQEIFRKICEYDEISRRYYDNAIKLLEKNEYSKAGETLWASIIEYLKIISLIAPPHRPLSSKHGEIRKFVRQLSESLKDPDLFNLFRKAEKLHAHFYENFLDEEEFGKHFNETKVLLQKLFELSRQFGRKGSS